MPSREGARLLRAASVSSPRRQPGELSPSLAGRRETPRGPSSRLARAALPGRSINPDCRLRDISGGQTCPALACGPRDGRRLQRNQRSPHRGAQAEIRPRQSRGPSASHRAGQRARDRRFDQIVCTGVLHHLADPTPGSRALRDVLEPDGAMHLMVYAPYGRTGVYMLQEFCRRVGIDATDEGIRDLVAALRGVAARASAGNPAARGAGLSAGGGACRCAAAPAGPRLFGAAAVRFPRQREG